MYLTNSSVTQMIRSIVSIPEVVDCTIEGVYERYYQ